MSIRYTIDGLPVTGIGDSAFGYTSLTSVTIGKGVTSIGDYAFDGCISLTSVAIPASVTSMGGGPGFYDGGGGVFEGCTSLTSVTIPGSVTRIGGGYGVGGAFEGCTSLTGVYFESNAPSDYLIVFGNDYNATVYYLPGTTGWGAMFDGRPTALWLPSFGVQANSETNGFGFSISWANNRSVVVEACANLSHPAWQPVATNMLTGGAAYCNDPQWTNYHARFYRLRSP